MPPLTGAPGERVGELVANLRRSCRSAVIPDLEDDRPGLLVDGLDSVAEEATAGRGGSRREAPTESRSSQHRENKSAHRETPPRAVLALSLRSWEATGRGEVSRERRSDAGRSSSRSWRSVAEEGAGGDPETGDAGSLSGDAGSGDAGPPFDVRTADLHRRAAPATLAAGRDVSVRPARQGQLHETSRGARGSSSPMSGCDVVAFLNHFDGEAGQTSWESDLALLFSIVPQNTQLVFAVTVRTATECGRG